MAAVVATRVAAVANNRPLPPEFCRRVLADSSIPDSQGLLEALASGSPSVAVRHNPLKGSCPAAGADIVPWCPLGEYLPERPNFTLDPLFHQGGYYVQDPSSMSLHAVIRSLGLDGPVNYLDACAAPGGKTTTAISALPPGSFVVANEADPARAAVLCQNLVKWGSPDVAVTLGPAQRLAKLPRELFHVIAADVPCSGEGMMRKDPVAVEQWTPGLVRACASLQREIVESLWPLLRPGGFLIYSTCTFAPDEDELNVAHFIDSLGARQLPLPDMPGVVRGHFYPHLVRGEGLFVALLQKPGVAAAPAPQITEKLLAKGGLRLLQWSLGPEFEPKGKTQIPTHALAMRADLPRGRWPEVEVDRPTALRFLHRDALTLPPSAPRGITLLTHGGLPLGWVNNLGSRANNLLPKHLRILSPLP